MKLNIANPSTGCQKTLEFDDDKLLRFLYEKRIAQELRADPLGDAWKGYIIRITGGRDKQGFPMMQGIQTNQRVRLLLSAKHKCYRPRRKGERRRKSIRGCIVGPDLSVLNLTIVKKGDSEIPGLTDAELPQRLGPKRASKIRKLFGLTKEDDVRKYVVRRTIPGKPAHVRGKAPKIQRLVTPVVLQRKKRRLALKAKRVENSRVAAADYAKLLAKRRAEARARRQELISRRRSSVRKDQPATEGAKTEEMKVDKAATTEKTVTKAPAATPGKKAKGAKGQAKGGAAQKKPAAGQQKGGQQKGAKAKGAAEGQKKPAAAGQQKGGAAEGQKKPAGQQQPKPAAGTQKPAAGQQKGGQQKAAAGTQKPAAGQQKGGQGRGKGGKQGGTPPKDGPK